MNPALSAQSSYDQHPLTLVEELLSERDWNYERLDEESLLSEVQGRWGVYHLYFVWREDAECLMASSVVETHVPEAQRQIANELISTINPKIWMGHFELSEDEENICYRYTFPLRGSTEFVPEQVEDILDSAITECDRFYPALQFVLWGGRTPQEAAFAAMVDIAGEA